MEEYSSESTESSMGSPVVTINRKRRRMKNPEKEYSVDKRKKCQMSKNDPRRNEVGRSNSSDDTHSHNDDDDDDDDNDQGPYSRLSEDEATSPADVHHIDSDETDIEIYDDNNIENNNSNDYDDDNNDNNNNNNNNDDGNIVHYRFRPFTAEAALAQQILSNTAGNICGILGKLEYHLSELCPKIRAITTYSNHFSKELEKLKDNMEKDLENSSST